MPVDVVCVASWNVDLIAHISQPLQRGETQMAQGFERLPGGKGSNAAIAAARQGAQVGLIARIGGDDFGQMGLDLWAHEGIASQHVVRGEGEVNGTALILVYEDGDNSIAVYPGAGAGLTAGHVHAASSMLAQARVVMASCEVPLAATRAAFEIARAHGVRTLLNPAPAMPLPDALWPLVDVLTPNEGELLMLAGAADVATAARTLLAKGAGAVVVTLGERGCALFRPDAEPLHVPGHPMPQVVDTIGAGDTPLPVLWRLRWPARHPGLKLCNGPMRRRLCPRRRKVR
jgi:ribokinase